MSWHSVDGFLATAASTDHARNVVDVFWTIIFHVVCAIRSTSPGSGVVVSCLSMQGAPSTSSSLSDWLVQRHGGDVANIYLVWSMHIVYTSEYVYVFNVYISDDVGGDGSDLSPHRGQITTTPYPTVFIHSIENCSDGGILVPARGRIASIPDPTRGYLCYSPRSPPPLPPSHCCTIRVASSTCRFLTPTRERGSQLLLLLCIDSACSIRIMLG